MRGADHEVQLIRRSLGTHLKYDGQLVNLVAVIELWNKAPSTAGNVQGITFALGLAKTKMVSLSGEYTGVGDNRMMRAWPVIGPRAQRMYDGIMDGLLKDSTEASRRVS